MLNMFVFSINCLVISVFHPLKFVLISVHDANDLLYTLGNNVLKSNSLVPWIQVYKMVDSFEPDMDKKNPLEK